MGIARVADEDEVFMMTAKGKIQRISAADISTIGRNTQGVRIMNVDDGDSLIAIVRAPAEEDNGEEEATGEGEATEGATQAAEDPAAEDSTVDDTGAKDASTEVADDESDDSPEADSSEDE